MSSSGRPLRFIAGALGGWTTWRVVMLWPAAVTAVQTLPGRNMVGAAPPLQRAPSAPAPPGAVLAGWAPSTIDPIARLHRASPLVLAGKHRIGDAGRAALATLSLVRFGPAQLVGVQETAAPASQPVGLLYVPIGQPQAPFAARWSASVWFLARGGTGLGTGPYGGQLGGGQAGLRLAYAIDRRRRLAIVGRIATPLAGTGREAAIGVEWRPTRLPVRLVAEQRIAIDAGGGGGPSIGIVGGAGPAPIGGQFRIEGYGQAGIIGRGGVIGFGDGALRINRPILQARGARIDLGAGAWGGVQPGAARLDIGPSLGLSLPVAGKRLRLSLDWRERIGGQARPGSGLALTIGGDF